MSNRFDDSEESFFLLLSNELYKDTFPHNKLRRFRNLVSPNLDFRRGNYYCRLISSSLSKRLTGKDQPKTAILNLNIVNTHPNSAHKEGVAIIPLNNHYTEYSGSPYFKLSDDIFNYIEVYLTDAAGDDLSVEDRALTCLFHIRRGSSDSYFI